MVSSNARSRYTPPQPGPIVDVCISTDRRDQQQFYASYLAVSLHSLHCKLRTSMMLYIVQSSAPHKRNNFIPMCVCASTSEGALQNRCMCCVHQIPVPLTYIHTNDSNATSRMCMKSTAPSRLSACRECVCVFECVLWAHSIAKPLAHALTHRHSTVHPTCSRSVHAIACKKCKLIISTTCVRAAVATAAC